MAAEGLELFRLIREKYSKTWIKMIDCMLGASAWCAVIRPIHAIIAMESEACMCKRQTILFQNGLQA